MWYLLLHFIEPVHISLIVVITMNIAFHKNNQYSVRRIIPKKQYQYSDRIKIIPGNQYFHKTTIIKVIILLVKIEMMSTLLLVSRSSSCYCNGFRLRSTVRRRNVVPYPRLLATTTTTTTPARMRKLTQSLYSNPTNTIPRTLLYSTSSVSTSTSSDNSISIDDTTLYRQFKDLSREIRQHDELYYSGNTDDNVISSMTTTTTNNNSVLVPISDDEFDALVRREEELEQKYPEFLHAWRIESGLDQTATRSGRIGSSLVSSSSSSSSSSSQSKSTKSKSTKTKSTQNKNNVRLKRKHLSPMLSLDNVHDDEQFHGWLRKVVKATNNKVVEQNPYTSDNTNTNTSISISIITEPKLDGVSLSLHYETKEEFSSIIDDDNDEVSLDLQWASTRGDGKIGQDVTATAKQISGIPLRIQLPLSSLSSSQLHNNNVNKTFAIEVRGEVVLPRSEFLRLQSEREEENITTTDNNDNTNKTVNSTSSSTTITSFSNSRNAASGILLRKDPKNPEEEQIQSNELRSLLQFYAYDISGLLQPRDNNRINTHRDEDDSTSSIDDNLYTDNTKSTTATATTVDKIMIEEEEGVTEIDGTRIRQQLSAWGFPVALPVTINEIQWNHNNRDIMDNKIDEIEWEESLREESIQDQIQPMLDYYSALKLHRERLQDEDLATATATATKLNKDGTKRQSRSSSSPKSEYDWGDFDVDGCVHKVSEATIKAAMGYSMKSPKWAVAHKFPAQSAVSRLLDIVVQVGRTGALTPVAILEPVEVNGVTIQRATLHNFGHLKEILGGDNDDDKIPKYEPVLIRRAGDVIPQVIKRIQGSTTSANDAGPADVDVGVDKDKWISLEPPKSCPACGSPVTYDTSSSSASSIGQVTRCNGPPLLCPPRAVTSLKHAFSRDALDITGLSESRIQQLMDADFLRYPNDIFQMEDSKWGDIAALPGWGEKSGKNLRGSSEKVATNGITLSRFIFSLGIRHVGKHTSELVASSYGTVEAFLVALDTAAQENTESSEQYRPFPQLQNKLGIGPVMVESLLAFSKTAELSAAKDLAESLNVLEEDVVVDEDSSETDSLSTESTNKSNQPWKGFRVVFTGSLDGMTRSEAQRIAKQLGAKSTPGSVSKSTDLVVYGEKGGKKLEQAQELGVTTMYAQDFILLAKEKGFVVENS